MKHSGRSKINRIPARGFYNEETIYKIIDEALYCHISFVQNNQPFIIPTIHARIENEIVLHGAKASRMLKHITTGKEVAIAVTLLDGLVLARSVFHHSMNYRSAVIFGKGRELNDKTEKLIALKAITNHLLPGRWDDARQPNDKELNATTVVAVKIEEASAKIRTGPPKDETDDYALPVWAGVLPLDSVYCEPVRDNLLDNTVNLPDYINQIIKR